MAASRRDEINAKLRVTGHYQQEPNAKSCGGDTHPKRRAWVAWGRGGEQEVRLP